MYKKVRTVIFIVVLVCSYNITLSMECEKVALPLQKSQIPILYINNYIVNVSSAYKGFKREIFLVDDFSKSVSIDRVNYIQSHKDTIQSQFRFKYKFNYAFFADHNYIKQSRPTQYPNFLYMYVKCKQRALPSDKIDLSLSLLPYIYFTQCAELICVRCIDENKRYANWEAKASEWLANLLECVVDDMIDKEYIGNCGIELYYHNRISDWIFIEKDF